MPQTITYFARKDPKLNLGIVLDGSGSMRSLGTRTKGFAKQLIASLNRNDEAFVERFIGSEQLSLLQDWTSDPAALANSVDKMGLSPGRPPSSME